MSTGYEWLNDRYVMTEGGNAVCSTTTNYTQVMMHSLPMGETPEYVYCEFCQCDIAIEHATCTQCGAPLRRI